MDQDAPFGIIDVYDASLILRKVVGRIARVEVQAPGAANHPQPETVRHPKPGPKERLLALRDGEGDRSGGGAEGGGREGGGVGAGGGPYGFGCDRVGRGRLAGLGGEGRWCWLDAEDRERWAARRAEGFNHVWVGRW